MTAQGQKVVVLGLWPQKMALILVLTPVVKLY